MIEIGIRDLAEVKNEVNNNIDTGSAPTPAPSVTTNNSTSTTGTSSSTNTSEYGLDEIQVNVKYGAIEAQTYTNSDGTTTTIETSNEFYDPSDVNLKTATIDIKTTNTSYQAILKQVTDFGITEFVGQTKIWGQPFKWLPSADPIRAEYSNSSLRYQYGRSYAKNFINDANLVYLRIGMPHFLPGAKQSEMKKVVYNLLTNEDTDANLELDSATSLRYYGFKNSFEEFTTVYASLLRTLAGKMGLLSANANLNYNYDKLGLTSDQIDYNNIEFLKMLQEAFIDGYFVSDSTGRSLFNKTTDANGIVTRLESTKHNVRQILEQSLCFYAQDISVSEDISNSTGDSKIASATKTAGSYRREANFLFGIKAADSLQKSAAENYSQSILGDFDSGIKILDRIAAGGDVVASGGNILFPEIWQDSTYRKSYNMTFVFSAPYGDPETILNQVYMPTLLWLTAAMPRQLGSMGYNSPFLVKAYSKGNFVCDLGMVDSVSIKRGPESEWTLDSLPTSIEVSVSIRDLYSTLILTASSDKSLWNTNTALKEFLNTFAGVTFSQVDPGAEINWFTKSLQRQLNVVTNVSTMTNQKINGAIASLAAKFQSSAMG